MKIMFYSGEALVNIQTLFLFLLFVLYLQNNLFFYCDKNLMENPSKYGKFFPIHCEWIGLNSVLIRNKK